MVFIVDFELKLLLILLIAKNRILIYYFIKQTKNFKLQTQYHYQKKPILYLRYYLKKTENIGTKLKILYSFHCRF